MTKDHFEHSKSAREGKASDNTSNIAVDDMGIPILEEIVTQNTVTDARKEEITPTPSSTESKPDLSMPSDEAVTDALREQLKSQLNSDIKTIAERVAVKVVTGMTSDLKQQIQAKLKEILENNLDEIIDKTIDDIQKNRS